MNYLSILKRGMSYHKKASHNWTKRRDKLIHAWVNCHPNPKIKTEKKDRLSEIIGELDTRVHALAREYDWQREKTRREHEQALQEFIHLECPQFECRYGPEAVGIGVRLMDYVPGKMICEKCGSTLITIEEREIEFMLVKMKISFSS